MQSPWPAILTGRGGDLQEQMQMAAQLEPTRKVVILDVLPSNLEPWIEALPECDVYALVGAPDCAPGCEVCILEPASENAPSKARVSELVASLFRSSPPPARIRMVANPAHILNGEGRILTAPRPKVVHLSALERREAAAREAQERKAKALAPCQFQSLADILQGVYEEKVPLFEGIFFPGAWLITGRPKVGKSWLLLQLALALAERTSFLTRECRALDAEVLLILAEDDTARVQSRLRALGVGQAPKNCLLVTGDQFRTIAAERSRYQPQFHEFIDQYLTEHPTCRLVIIDTETSCRLIWQGESKANESKLATKTDYSEVGDMDKVALKHKAVIALVNHTSKVKGGANAVLDPHEMINRTNTALAAASGQMVLTNCPGFEDTPEMKMRQASWRGRDLIDDMNWALQQGTGMDLPLFAYRGDLGDVIQNQAELAILTAVETIAEEEHTQRYVSSGEIAEEIGKSREAVKRAITRMFKTGTRRFHKGRLVDHKRGRDGGLRLIGNGLS